MDRPERAGPPELSHGIDRRLPASVLLAGERQGHMLSWRLHGGQWLIPPRLIPPRLIHAGLASFGTGPVRVVAVRKLSITMTSLRRIAGGRVLRGGLAPPGERPRSGAGTGHLIVHVARRFRGALITGPRLVLRLVIRITAPAEGLSESVTMLPTRQIHEFALGLCCRAAHHLASAVPAHRTTLHRLLEFRQLSQTPSHPEQIAGLVWRHARCRGRIGRQVLEAEDMMNPSLRDDHQVEGRPHQAHLRATDGRCEVPVDTLLRRCRRVESPFEVPVFRH